MSTPAINIQEIKRKAFFGVVALQLRSHVLQIIAGIGKLILAALLNPAAWGVFAIVNSIINFLNYFQDVGLGAALIQKKDEPTRADLVTTFTIQQLLVGSGVIIILILSSQIAGQFGLNHDNGSLFLLRSFAIAFFLSSLRSIPSILLERKLEFQKLVLPQIGETIIFYLVAILLAWRGYGVVSYAWATLARGIVGTIMIYAVAPWKIGFGFYKESARKLLSFGLPFQAPSFLALIKDDLIILYIAQILPLSYVGYITFAKQMAELMMRNVMDNVIRVTFPTFARLQHDYQILAKAIHKSIQFLALLVLPIAAGMLFIIKPFMEVIPRYAKWEPALFSFYLFTIGFILSTLSTPIYNALNALGKVKITLSLQIFWTIATWILVPIGLNWFGYHGFAIAALLINFTSFLPIVLIKRLLPLEITKNIQQPVIATVVMSAFLALIYLFLPEAKFKIAVGIPIGILSYSIVIYYLMGKEIKAYINLFKKN